MTQNHPAGLNQHMPLQPQPLNAQPRPMNPLNNQMLINQPQFPVPQRPGLPGENSAFTGIGPKPMDTLQTGLIR